MHKSVTIPPRPVRPVDAHKGTFGMVMVVGGCTTMMGAPALCATAALRSGAGLVKIATPSNVLPVAIGIEPCATGVVVSATISDTLFNLDQADPHHKAVLAVGPGMGQSQTAGQLVGELLGGDRPVVLDADGLNLLAATGQSRPSNGPAMVLTPHVGEYARLAKSAGITADATTSKGRTDAAVKMAKAQNAVVVLKGFQSIVSNGEQVYANHTGNPSLATAGSGDVLTGVIAALMAQHMPPFDAAVLGVYLHGLAADLWAKDFGSSGLTARDLANLLPQAFSVHH